MYPTNPTLLVITEPAQEPISVTEAKDHLRITTDAEDGRLLMLITAARRHLEAQDGRAFVTQTLELRLDRFPAERFLELPRPPLQSVTSVKYTPSGGVETTFPAASYNVDTATTDRRGRVLLKQAQSWPTDQLEPGGLIKIQYVAGYGNASTVPEERRQAVLIALELLYEHRDDDRTGPQLMQTVDRLLARDGLLRLA